MTKNAPCFTTRFQMNLPRIVQERRRSRRGRGCGSGSQQHCMRWSIRRQLVRPRRLKVI